MKNTTKKTLDIIFRATVCLPLTIVSFPLYTLAYVIAHVFKIAEYDDMISLLEYLTLWAKLETIALYDCWEIE